MGRWLNTTPLKAIFLVINTKTQLVIRDMRVILTNLLIEVVQTLIPVHSEPPSNIFKCDRRYLLKNAWILLCVVTVSPKLFHCLCYSAEQNQMGIPWTFMFPFKGIIYNLFLSTLWSFHHWKIWINKHFFYSFYKSNVAIVFIWMLTISLIVPKLCPIGLCTQKEN